ncbi:MAG: GtrA family protein [Pirellulales bacterium]
MDQSAPINRMSARENKRQIVRFLIVGALSVAVDLACYMLFAATLFFATSLAKGLSYIVGMAVGFVGNKYWTFGSARRAADEPVTYVALYTVTLAVNIGVNAAVLSVTGGWTLPAFLVATGVTTVLNFLGMRLVTFRHGIQDRLREHGAAEPPSLSAVPAPHRTADRTSPRTLARG